jgi:hypothetical protein
MTTRWNSPRATRCTMSAGTMRGRPRCTMRRPAIVLRRYVQDRPGRGGPLHPRVQPQGVPQEHPADA